MKKKTLISVLIISVFLLSGFAFAGISPSPFRSEINKLNANVKVLLSIENSVTIYLGFPPDPVEPDSSFIGVINRFEAMENQVILLHDFTVSVVEEVLGVPPDPVHLLPALYDIRDVSQSIADVISLYVGDWPPDYQYAPLAVQEAAQNLSDQTQEYIDTIQTSSECTPDPDINTESDCSAYLYCVWIEDGSSPPYCCCY